MRLLSSALIVACGTALLITSSLRELAANRDSLFNMGLLLGVIGIVGWAFAMKAPPRPHDHPPDDHK